MPEVSVIIPTYNRAGYLPESVKSVLSQTFTDIELVVVDDGSTDGTPEVVSGFLGDERVRYIHQQNRGDAAARNSGIANSSGEYVAFLDSDDLWLPEKLQRQVAVLRENPDIGVVYTAAILQQIDGDHQEVWRHTLRPPAMHEQTLYEQLLYENIITGSHSSVMVRREALDRVGLFDEDLPFVCDHDLWRRLAEHYAFRAVDEPLVCIRMHGTNISKDTELMAEYDRRYLAKLSREIAPKYRWHLPRVAFFRFAAWTWRLLTQGRFRAAGSTGWFAVTNAFRSPLAVPGLLLRLTRRQFSKWLWLARARFGVRR